MAAHEVRLPLAIESGSRAWGFPSPDSDYDCRFIFVRPLKQLLTPWPRRDVIEAPLDGVLDVNGWELGKALKLLLKGNAVIIEWLRSPIVYCGETWFRDELLAFAEKFAERNLIAHHYRRLGEKQRSVYFADVEDVPQKKIFYALRPAAALRWLRLRPDAKIAPMHFSTLMSECEPPAAVAALTAALLERKAASRELGTAPLPAPLAAFIDDELAAARAQFSQDAAPLSIEARGEAERFYRRAVEQCYDLKIDV